MSQAPRSLPPEYRAGYIAERTPFVRARVGLYSVVATLLYTVATLQYGLRQLLTGDPYLFRASELPYLLVLLAGTAVCYGLNARTRTIEASKLCAYAYTALFLFCFTGYALVYREHAFLFVFYYSCALILTALMIPWRMGEIAGLSAVYTLVFSAYIGVLALWQEYSIWVFPRFHFYMDGLVFLSIAVAVSLIIRHNDIRHDIQNYVLLKTVESQAGQIQKELKLADRVHKTLIPQSMDSRDADVAVTYLPMGFIGGDCAKFRFLEDGRLAVFISDVTGHGVPAALLVNRVHGEYERLLREDPSPGTLLKNLNRFIWRDFEGTGMYLTAFCGLIDLSSGTLKYSNYGHPPQVLYNPGDAEVRELRSQGGLLGLAFDESEHHEATARFGPGGRLVLFTDGVTETAGRSREFFGDERLKAFIKARADLTAARFNDALVGELKAFASGRFTDDVFILSVRSKKP